MKEWEKILSVLHQASALGEEKLSNGALLIGRVPHVAPQAWLHSIYAPLEESDIRDLENEMGRELPSSFKAFLKLANGINIFSDSLSLKGLRRNYARTGDEARQPYDIMLPNRGGKPKDALKNHVLIGGYSWDGSHLFIDETTGKTFCSERRTAKPYKEWESFEEMLVTETTRIASLFDKTGRQLDPKLPTTPR
jgi:hypothetical protein